MTVLLACGSEVATPGDTPPPPTTAEATTAATASPQTEAATSTPPVTATRTAPTAPTLTPTPTPISTPVPTDTPAATPTPTPAPTSTPVPTDTPTATPVPYGSRENPVRFGGTARISHDDPAHRWEFVVLTTIPDAWFLIQSEDQSNDSPRDGRQFYMVHIQAGYIGPEHSVLSLSAEFQAVGASNEAVDGFGCGAFPDPLDIYSAQFPGRPIEGNLCFDVPSEDADSLVLFVDVGANSGNPVRVWLALRMLETAPTGGPGRAEVEEYARTVCGSAGNTSDPGTWGEYADALNDFTDTVEGLTPPDAVVGFHQAYLALAKALLPFAEERGRSTRFDEDAFGDIPSLEEFFNRVLGEVRNLDPGTYDTLSLAGCF